MEMKRYFLPLSVAILSVILLSCSTDDDHYSLNDAWVGFGMLYQDAGSGMGYCISLDDGDKIFPVASDVNMHAFDDSSRVLVNFTILDQKADSSDWKEYYVKINQIQDILMKGILDITEQNEDSIGNDPIIVKNAWISGDLLTFELKYWGNNEIHFINLVKQPDQLVAANQPIELELKHNDRDDGRLWQYSGYVSFNLSALKIAGQDSVRFSVKATDYDGRLYQDEGVYHYKR